MSEVFKAMADQVANAQRIKTLEERNSKLEKKLIMHVKICNKSRYLLT